MNKIDHYISQALVIKPGDRVLLAVSEVTDEEHAKALRDSLKERFPDAEFTVVAGVSAMAVERA